MSNETTPEAQELLGKESKVLDHGFVRLVDYMGSDAAIVQGARVSYGKGTKKVSEDRELIRYLMRHRHTSPFEMVEFKFHVKLPIFIARQWIRHRTANVNEYSGRYSVMKEEFYVPESDEVRFQSTVNKQGRSTEEVPDQIKNNYLDYLKSSHKDSYAKYKQFVDDGLARELARIVLPLSLYTEWYWKIDLHNLLHFLKLRIDPHAQKEIRLYAITMANMVKVICPMAFEAFEDYILNSVTFSGPEIRALGNRLADIKTDQLTQSGFSKLEGHELKEKLKRIKSAQDE